MGEIYLQALQAHLWLVAAEVQSKRSNEQLRHQFALTKMPTLG